MFTIKFRSYHRAFEQPSEGPPVYDPSEQITGPYDLVSQETLDGWPVVYAHVGDGPAVSFGSFREDEAGKPRPAVSFGSFREDEAGKPRPSLWVMNSSGATVAHYRL